MTFNSTRYIRNFEVVIRSLDTDFLSTPHGTLGTLPSLNGGGSLKTFNSTRYIRNGRVVPAEDVFPHEDFQLHTVH